MISRRQMVQCLAVASVPAAAVTVAASSLIPKRMPDSPKMVKTGDMMLAEDWNKLVAAVRDLQERV